MQCLLTPLPVFFYTILYCSGRSLFPKSPRCILYALYCNISSNNYSKRMCSTSTKNAGCAVPKTQRHFQCFFRPLTILNILHFLIPKKASIWNSCAQNSLSRSYVCVLVTKSTHVYQDLKSTNMCWNILTNAKHAQNTRALKKLVDDFNVPSALLLLPVSNIWPNSS